MQQQNSSGFTQLAVVGEQTFVVIHSQVTIILATETIMSWLQFGKGYMTKQPLPIRKIKVYSESSTL